MAQAMRTMPVQGRAMLPAMTRPVARPHLVVVRAGLLDFFLPKTASTDPRAAELVEELIDLASSTVAGTKASPEKREAIEGLVGELQQFGIKNPVRSKQLFGEYEVLYSSQPSAAGSPLAGPSGVIAPSGKLPVEVLGEDGSYSSSVEFKALGFLGGSFKQAGSIKAVSNTSYLLEIEEATYQSGLGGPSVKQVDSSFEVQMVYLGEDLRVVEVFPAGSQDGTLVVTKRVQEQAQEEEEEPAAALKPFGSMIMKPQDSGIATVAERQVLRQMAKEKAAQSGTGGTRVAKVSGTGGTRVAKVSGTASVQAGPSAAAKQADAKAQAAKAKEAAEKEKAALAARDRAEAEKQAAADRQGAIRDLLSSLTDAVKGRGAEAKEAIQNLKNVERSNGAVLKKTSAARSKLEEAQRDSAEAEEALAQAGTALKQAEQNFKEAQAAVAQAQAALKAAQSAAGPKIN